MLLCGLWRIRAVAGFRVFSAVLRNVAYTSTAVKLALRGLLTAMGGRCSYCGVDICRGDTDRCCDEVRTKLCDDWCWGERSLCLFFITLLLLVSFVH